MRRPEEALRSAALYDLGDPADPVRFFAAGCPQTKGSARAFHRPGMKHPVVTNDNPKAKALTGVVYADDGQVSGLVARKVWAEAGESVGVEVRVAGERVLL